MRSRTAFASVEGGGLPATMLPTTNTPTTNTPSNPLIRKRGRREGRGTGRAGEREDRWRDPLINQLSTTAPPSEPAEPDGVDNLADALGDNSVRNRVDNLAGD